MRASTVLRHSATLQNRIARRLTPILARGLLAKGEDQGGKPSKPLFWPPSYFCWRTSTPPGASPLHASASFRQLDPHPTTMRIHKVKTPQIKQAYELSGPETGEPIFLVHGWPDSPRTWDKVLPTLHSAGYRTVVPYLRSYGPSTFRTRLLGRSPRRTGQPVAYAADMLHLADHLRLKRFHFIGHDWGARTAYALAALAPERLKSLVTLSVPFEPGRAEPPAFPQARAFWYQWLLCTLPGEKRFRTDPVAFGRAQWDAWSPAGWYTEAEFAETARSWKGTDFQDVVLHAYRSRWGHATLDPHYSKPQARFHATKTLKTPTTLIHGMEDHCELLETTDGAEKYFTARYDRVVFAGVGHFVQREAPDRTAAALLDHLRRHA